MKQVFSFINQPQNIDILRLQINSIMEEVTERNKRITELVANREGEKHAIEFFTDDAIYLTYDSPMFVGLDRIKAYFIEHEKPGDLTINKLDIRASKIIDIGNFIIEYGYYTIDVAWNSGRWNF